ncbi:MAG: hypothetical protein HPY61_14130 [Methanotrichaceae archaeon]|nr:hypothetical protein [Methanotrichaceae archaeon]
MDMQSFEAKERHLSSLLAQEVKDLLDLLRFKCINKDTDCLGFEIPCFVGEASVIAFLAITEQRIELSAQWEGRPTRTHYLLRGGFVNLPVLQEGLQVLETAWKTVLESPADPEVMGKDWDQEVKGSLMAIRILRERRVKMLTEMEKKFLEIDGTTEHHAVKGAIGCGFDIKMVTKAEQAALMQRTEKEDVLP